MPANVCPRSLDGAVELSWDVPDDDNVKGFVVETAPYGSGTWTLAATVGRFDVATINAPNGVRARYRVAAINESGDRSNWGGVCAFQWGDSWNEGSRPARWKVQVEPVADIDLAGEFVVCTVSIVGLVACSDTDLTVAPVDLGQSVTQVSGQFSFRCAVSVAATVVCSGANNFGQLGDGTYNFGTTTVSGGALAGVAVREIDTGERHACALTREQRIACWGGNVNGQIGDGTLRNRPTPTLVNTGVLRGQDVKLMSSGLYSNCAITTSNIIGCWGNVDIEPISVTPKAVGGGALVGRNFTSVSVGYHHACALTDSGEVLCWKLENDMVATLVGGKLTGLSIAAINAGTYHTCASTAVGAVACWGQNLYGQLGDGTSKDSPEPTFVDATVFAGGGVVSLTGSERRTAALWDGSAAAGIPPSEPFRLRASSDDEALRVSWLRPSSGASQIVSYSIEGSRDAGRTWRYFGDASTTTVELDGLSDGFWMFRAKARSAVGESQWSEPSAEVLHWTEQRTTKSNVEVQLITPSGDPIVGASVLWTTTDGQLAGERSVRSDDEGRVRFPVIATGPVRFGLDGGRVGDTEVLVGSATLTDVVQRSGRRVVLTTPTSPVIVERQVRVQMPDRSPVPDTTIEIVGGLAPTVNSGTRTEQRSFTVQWRREGGLGTLRTGVNGTAVLTGFVSPSSGVDVRATFSDGFIRQSASAYFDLGLATVVFEQMPVIQVVGAPDPVEPGAEAEVVVKAVDGTGDPIVDTDIELVLLDGAGRTAQATTGARCRPRLVASTNSVGRARLRVCPSRTALWRADGAEIVASRPIRIAVTPVRLQVRKEGRGKGRVQSSPRGINCGDRCTARFDKNSTVILTASPTPGSDFQGWTGGGCEGAGRCRTTLSRSTTVTATFRRS